MRRANVLGVGLLVAAVTLHAIPAWSQTEIGVDLGLFSSYVWRGLTMTNKPVAQPALYVSFPVGSASLTAGGWSNVDLGKYDDFADDLSQSGGSSAFNLSEFQPYAEVSFPLGRATLTGGVTGYIYPNDAPAPAFGLMTSGENTWEIYGKLGFDAPLSPEVSVYYDIDRVKGAYIEGGVRYSLEASERVSVDLGAVAGFSAGQDASGGLEELPRFLDDGFTHVDLSAGIPFIAGSIAITPVIHVIVTGDEFTKTTSPTDESDVKLWGGVSLSWSRVLGAIPEEETGT
jgi:uncharacterized protein Gcw-chp